MSADAIMHTMQLAAASDQSSSVAVHPHLCLGPPDQKHMSGGVCTALMAMALEARFERPLIQCSTFFMRAPPIGSQAEIKAEALQEGRTVVLARAELASGGSAGAVLQASLGEFTGVDDVQWMAPIEAPAPETCAPLVFIRRDMEDLHAQLDIRIASDKREATPGALNWWIRSPTEPGANATGFLALVADYVPEAVHHGLGRPAGAISLDNSLRICGRELTPWLHCETRLSVIRSGLFHGSMMIRNQEGRLLAIGSQTGLVREMS